MVEKFQRTVCIIFENENKNTNMEIAHGSNPRLAAKSSIFRRTDIWELCTLGQFSVERIQDESLT